jgi:uncharacterized membrane protein YjgN (DUF898 family)
VGYAAGLAFGNLKTGSDMSTLDAAVPAAQPSLAARFRLPTGPIQFLGFERDYWRIWIRGSVLLAVTLGIYRFWLTTDTRQFLWSNTEVLGEPLEYTGTARELLIGFLIAVAILIPFYAFIFLLALSVDQLRELAGLVGFVLATLLGNFAVYRARRYRLTRTVFRGVRFHQTGSAWHYAVKAVLWWTLVILTLGLAYPIAQSRLEQFKMRNTWLGNLQGRFEGSAANLFVRGLFMWLIVAGPLIASLVAIGAELDIATLQQLAENSSEEAFTRFIESRPALASAFAFAIGAVTWAILIGMLLYPVFQAMVLRWWTSGLRFGEMVASSTLRTGEVYVCYLRYVGWSIVFSTIGSIAVMVLIGAIASLLWATGLLQSQWLAEAGEIILVIVPVALYVIFALGYAVIYQVKVRLGIWRAVANSAGLSNPATLESISSIGAPASAVGEGLADALNVGGF